MCKKGKYKNAVEEFEIYKTFKINNNEYINERPT